MSDPSHPFVIAVDAGGTHTRVGCFGLDGALLAHVRGRGGSRIHNHDAEDNVLQALAQCLSAGRLDPADAAGIGVGLSGVSRTGSNQGDGGNDWASAYVALPGLACPRTIVNDAVAAHRGALLGRAGVIVVAGTGSMILAITDQGEEIESGQFEHYAGGARHLVFDAMGLVLAGAGTAADEPLLAEVFAHFGVDDLTGLRCALLDLGRLDRNEVKRRYGTLAPVVTAAADTSQLADRAVRELARKTARGVAVLAPLIGERPVLVSTSGALATEPHFAARLRAALAEETGTPTTLVPAATDPLRGAALLAYEVAGIDPPAPFPPLSGKAERCVRR